MSIGDKIVGGINFVMSIPSKVSIAKENVSMLKHLGKTLIEERKERKEEKRKNREEKEVKREMIIAARSSHFKIKKI